MSDSASNHEASKRGPGEHGESELKDDTGNGAQPSNEARWLRRIAGLQIEFAKPVERCDRPLGARDCIRQPKRDGLGPRP